MIRLMLRRWRKSREGIFKTRSKITNRFTCMIYISLWACDLDTATDLPRHLQRLYESVSRSALQRDPEVCAEREPVPVEELLEPFSLPEAFLLEATAAAQQKSLRLAAAVIAVYTRDAPPQEAVQPVGCQLQFLGTFPGN